MTKQEYIEKMPKIDLHCHLDGSLPLHTIRSLAGRTHVTVPRDATDLMNLVTAPQECTSLSEYLTRFDLPSSLLQSTENLVEASYDFIAEVSKENVVYMEVRFAPTHSIREELSLDSVVDSVLRGLELGKRQFGVDYGVILCAMRNLSFEVNSQLLPLAEKYCKRGVVALDLAGDEKAFPVQMHRNLFEQARHKNIPFTIHAGEGDGPASVRAALSLGAQRIGHGIAMKSDAEVREHCRQNSIGIELCPTSNTQTKAAASWKEYPFPMFMNEGLPITVNTDNRTVSDTTLTKEFKQLDALYNLETEVLETLYRNAVKLSFADNVQKERLHGVFDRFKISVSA